jgi:hypothetical protein
MARVEGRNRSVSEPSGLISILSISREVFMHPTAMDYSSLRRLNEAADAADATRAHAQRLFRYPTNRDRIPNVMIAPFSLANLRLIQIEDLLSMQQVRLLSP